jgi:hypothetical protein
MPIIDQEKWDNYVETNQGDDYSKCCVDIARRVMEILDEDPTTLRPGYHPDPHTPHGIICNADTDIKAGGITGFMAGAATQMVCECHSRGAEFKKIHNAEHGVTDEAAGVVNPAIMEITVPDGKTAEEIITEAAEASGMEVLSEEETLKHFGIEPKEEEGDERG